MDFNDLTKRLERVYASIGMMVSLDYQKHIRWTPGEFDIHFGTTDDPTDENKVVSIISAIADLKDNLKSKMSSSGLNPKLVEDEINNSLPLQLITDLDNQSKHGYPLTKTRRSNLDPLIKNVTSSVSFRIGPGGDLGFWLDLDNEQVTTQGDTIVESVLDADITDGSGNLVTSLDIMVNESITLWETFITANGLK